MPTGHGFDTWLVAEVPHGRPCGHLPFSPSPWHVEAMALVALLHRVLPLLAVVGLLLGPLIAPAQSAPMTMAGMGTTKSEMPCCPHDFPLKPDCQKDCPLLAMCVSKCAPFQSFAGRDDISVIVLRSLRPANDQLAPGTVAKPPPRPPRT
jgi:hypothetical protein